MYKKVTALLFLALVADVYSGAIVAQPAAIISAKSELAEDVETDSHPSYSFSYAVDDVTTGDHKSQFETRDGDAVVGRYTVLEPTGETRQVDYTADAVNGFNAVVSRHSTAKIIAAAPAKIIAQPAIVAPAKIISQPIVAASPAKFYSQPTIVAPAPTKLVAAAPYIAAPAKIVSAHPYAKYAYAAPYAAYSAPLVAQYHAPAAAYISHSPLAYHAPAAAAIIHH